MSETTDEAVRRRVPMDQTPRRSADLPVPRGTPPEAAPPRRERTRVPFGAMEQKLAYPERPGYHRHWFNDVPGRIERAKLAGYEHVQGTDGKPVARVVGRDQGGGGLVAYLMEIPSGWYEEDMEEAQAHRDEIANSIRRGDFKAPDHGYVPQQGIKIERR